MDFEQKSTRLRFIQTLLTATYTYCASCLACKSYLPYLQGDHDCGDRVCAKMKWRLAVVCMQELSQLHISHLHLVKNGSDTFYTVIQLKSLITSAVDATRLKDVTKDVLMVSFSAFEQGDDILPENVCSMNEPGFSIGTLETSLVVFDSRIQKKHQTQARRQEESL